MVFTTGLKGYHGCWHTQKHYLSSNDIIADENLDKRRQPKLELAISGRHRGHYLWLMTKSYSGIPNNLRRQAKAIFV